MDVKRNWMIFFDGRIEDFKHFMINVSINKMFQKQSKT